MPTANEVLEDITALYAPLKQDDDWLLSDANLAAIVHYAFTAGEVASAEGTLTNFSTTAKGADDDRC